MKPLVCLLLVLALVSPTFAGDPCSDVKANRDRVRKQLDDLQATQLPEERLDDYDRILGQLEDVLNGNNKDQNDVVEKIEKLEEKLPKSDSAFKQTVDQMLGAVKGGLKGSAQKQKEAADFISGMRGRLNTIKTFYEAGDQASAQATINKFGDFFEQLSNLVPGAAEIPGMKDLFKAYTDGIHGIAKSAGQIEQVVDRDNQIMRDADELHRDAYLRPKSPRELRADNIAKLGAELSDLEGKVADCNEKDADGKPDKCSDPSSRVVRDMDVIHRTLDPDHDMQQQVYDERCHNYFGEAITAAATMNDTKQSAAERAKAKGTYDTYNKMYWKCESDRANNNRDYEKKLGDMVNAASGAGKYTKAENKLLDDCFPHASLLKDQSRLRPKSPKPVDKLKNSKTTPTKTADGDQKQQQKPPCQNGSITGAVQGISDAIQGSCQ